MLIIVQNEDRRECYGGMLSLDLGLGTREVCGGGGALKVQISVNISTLTSSLVDDYDAMILCTDVIVIAM